jgi:histidine phosphotransferase ChpT
MHEPRAVIDALVGNNGRIAVSWALTSDMMPKPAVKVLLNLAMIGIEALVRGGTLDIVAETHDTGGGRVSEIVIRASGARIAFDPTVGQALDGTLPTDALSAKTAPAYMIQQLVAGFGGGLQTQVSSEQLVMGAVLPAA